MSAPAQQLARIAEQGGGAVAVTSGLIGWLNANHAAVAAMCGIGGLCIALAGFAVHWYYARKKFLASRRTGDGE